MNNTLKRIIKRANTRKIIGKTAAWYKISYWKHFGCDSYNHREIQEMRGKDAGQCAAERMAHMKQIVLEGNTTTDNDHINHINPIKIAYDMGKNCLKNTLLYNSYINKFRKYYKELIAVKPELHKLFQTALGEGEYPLELNKENEVKTNNPIVYQNNKTIKRQNTQTPNNKTKRTNKTVKYSNKITLV